MNVYLRQLQDVFLVIALMGRVVTRRCICSGRTQEHAQHTGEHEPFTSAAQHRHDSIHTMLLYQKNHCPRKKKDRGIPA